MTSDADHEFFQKLLGMVPNHLIFKSEEIDTAQNTEAEQKQTKTGGVQKEGKKRKQQSLSNSQNMSGTNQDIVSVREEKIKGKKESKQKKKKKQKDKKESKINIEEAQEKLRARIAELQAKRAQNLTGAEMQERKRLERKQKKLKARGKQKNKKKESGQADSGVSADTSQPSPVKKTAPVVTKEGKLVFSKFDFKGEKQKKSDLAGKDFKRILARLEQREAKVAKLKESNTEAASRLEEKFVWQDVMLKAKGEKIKDDVSKLKNAIKRKDKVKEQRKTKWKQRKSTEEKMQKQRQDKREENLQKRKDEKKAKHRKKLIKKGRILPGF